MMTRAEVYSLVDEERQGQTKRYPRDEHPSVPQYRFVAPHVLLLQEKIAKIRSGWYGDDADLKQAMVQIAALAVRALEEVEVWE